MQLSSEGLELIKRFEGFRSRQYTDVAGFPTIGYGHRIVPPESFPGGLSEPQAANLLARDVSAAELAVGHLVKVALTQGQFDALVDFCFNLGCGAPGRLHSPPRAQRRPLRRRCRATPPLGSRRRRSESGFEGPPRSRTPPLEIGTATLPGKLFAAAANRRRPVHLLRSSTQAYRSAA